MNRAFLLISCVLFCAIGALLLGWPSSGQTVVLCDVGQGDAVLIASGFTQVLIDGGPDETVLECLGQFMPYWDKRIELLVATHPDADHIGGLVAVLQKYQVSEIWENGQHNAKQTKLAADFEALAASQVVRGARLHAVSSGDGFVATDKKIIARVLSPSSRGGALVTGNAAQSEATLSDKIPEKVSDSLVGNNGSIVLLLEISEVKVLLVGDLEKEGELALLQQDMIPDVHILKIGHHGAKNSSSIDFLHTSRPEIALIGVGKKNSYGHPAPEVIDRLNQLGAVTIRTDELGTVSLHLKNGVISGSVFEKFRH